MSGAPGDVADSEERGAWWNSVCSEVWASWAALTWVRSLGMRSSGVSLLARGVFLGFHVGHDLGESFVSAGEDGGEGAEAGAGLEAAPMEAVQVAALGGVFDGAEA